MGGGRKQKGLPPAALGLWCHMAGEVERWVGMEGYLDEAREKGRGSTTASVAETS